MKTLSLLLVIMMTSLSSCLKDPGTPVLTAVKTIVAVNEELTITLGGADNFTCLVWSTDGPAYTIISGGGNSDKSVKIKYSATGTSTWNVAVKNCKDGDDDCTGTCRDEYAEIIIIVQ
jgi:hypothetical protein